jgi:aminopeptidase YwaD
MKHLITLFLFIGIFFQTYSQDLDFAREVLDSLTAEYMHGRGYIKDGHIKAADFIGNEYGELGIKPFGEIYFQEFMINVNTFPGELSLEVNGTELIPGVDYLVDACSPGGTYDDKVVMLEMEGEIDIEDVAKQLVSSKNKDKFIIINKRSLNLSTKEAKEKYYSLLSFIKYAQEPVVMGAVVLDSDKLTWHKAQEECLRPIIYVQKDVGSKIKRIRFNVETKFERNMLTQNTIGYIKGSKYPDSFFVFSAHYDHLGQMGDQVYFPGANDDASGVAMLLNLARYYAVNPQEYSVCFMAFGAEEVNIFGSKYYTENPLFQLDKIKFMINMDIVGTGDEGITVVNATEFPGAFDRLNKINDTKGYLPQIKKRGKAMNSDHYYFTEKGVPSFFIYTRGGIKAYHDVYDIAETLPLTEFGDLFKLIVDFVGSYSKTD